MSSAFSFMMHLCGSVLFISILPGTSRRNIRIGDSDYDARQQTNSFLKTRERAAETHEGGFSAASRALGGVSNGGAFVDRSWQQGPPARAPYGRPQPATWNRRLPGAAAPLRLPLRAGRPRLDAAAAVDALRLRGGDAYTQAESKMATTNALDGQTDTYSTAVQSNADEPAANAQGTAENERGTEQASEQASGQEETATDPEEEEERHLRQKGLGRQEGSAKKTDEYSTAMQSSADDLTANAQGKAENERGTEQASEQARSQTKEAIDPKQEEASLLRRNKLGMKQRLAKKTSKNSAAVLSNVDKLRQKILDWNPNIGLDLIKAWALGNAIAAVAIIPSLIDKD